MVAEGIAINSTPALEFESLDSARDILGALRADPHIEMAVIYDRKGNSVDYRRADLAASAVPALSRKEGAYFEDGKLRIYRSCAARGRSSAPSSSSPTCRSCCDRLATYARVVAIVALASLLAALLLASQLQKLISRPIRHLAEVETRVSREKDFTLRAVKDTEDELGVLIDGFNDMLVQIQQRDEDLMLAKEGGGAGQPHQERVPRQHEPRAAHAAERHHRLQRDAAGGGGRTPARRTRSPTSRRSTPRASTCSPSSTTSSTCRRSRPGRWSCTSRPST